MEKVLNFYFHYHRFTPNGVVNKNEILRSAKDKYSKVIVTSTMLNPTESLSVTDPGRDRPRKQI